MSGSISDQDIPTSFGTFKPVGHLMLGLPNLAGFGYEITMLRRYLDLSREGYQWLLVKVGNSEHASVAAELARAQGARLAVHYRTLTVEELI